MTDDRDKLKEELASAPTLLVEGHLSERARQELLEEERGSKSDHAYQVVGTLLSLLGAFETAEGQRALDYFCGDEYDGDFLPWPREHLLPQHDRGVEDLARRLEAQKHDEYCNGLPVKICREAADLLRCQRAEIRTLRSAAVKLDETVEKLVEALKPLAALKDFHGRRPETEWERQVEKAHSLVKRLSPKEGK